MGIYREHDKFKKLKETQPAKGWRHGGDRYKVRLERGRDQFGKGQRTQKSEGHWLDGMCTLKKSFQLPCGLGKGQEQ